MKLDKDFNFKKEEIRVSINIMLLGIAFTLFTFLIAFNQEILSQNILITLQLTVAIPFLMSSILARAKAGYTPHEKIWKKFGYITYLIAYAFLINVIGIFIIYFVSTPAGIAFFIINIILAVSYSLIEISYDRSIIKERVTKDLAFLLILVLLGILPALKFY